MSSLCLTQCLGKAPEAILFDLDGTLVDSVKDMHSALQSALLGYGEVTEESVRGWVGNGSLKLIERALTFLAIDHNDHQRSIHDAFLTFYGQTHFNQTSVYDGAWYLLDQLKAAAIPCAIVTNKPSQFTRALLAKVALSDYFKLVLAADDTLKIKPSPIPLLMAADILSVDPKSCIMIGDSANDIEAAKAAQMHSIAVTYGYDQGRDIITLGADGYVDDLADIDLV